LAGRCSSYFTIEINHGGFFVGNGCNRSYVDGHIIYYDQIDTLMWSPLLLENIVEEIGYELAGRMKVFCCIPMLTIEKNELREIIDEVGTNFMNNLVDIGQHYFKIYLDHDQSMSLKNYDDVVHFPVVPLPPVISP
jgi:hypothetical protein